MIHSPRYIFKSLLLAAFVLASVASFGVGAAAAKSKPPCWKTLINDWYDGRIDGTYPVHCYRDALKHLPTDVETYSSARDDIKQALQKRLTQAANPGSTTTTTGGSTGGGKNGGSGQGGGGSTGGGGGNTGGNGGDGTPVKSVFGAGKGDHADSFPVALIVLGGIAGLLMAAGAAGFITRRSRTRRIQLAAASAKQPPQTP